MIFPYNYDNVPLGAMVIVLLIGGCLLGFVIYSEHQASEEFVKTFVNKEVSIPAFSTTGVVIGRHYAKYEGYIWHIRLQNGKVVEISSKQVEILSEQKPEKQIQAEKLEAEIKLKQEELKTLKDTK